MGNRLLSTREVLERLGISRPTLYSLMEEGKIRPIEKPSYLKRQARLQFKESDVERLLHGESTAEEEPPGNHVAIAV